MKGALAQKGAAGAIFDKEVFTQCAVEKPDLNDAECRKVTGWI
jgi:hypothetical protein